VKPVCVNGKESAKLKTATKELPAVRCLVELCGAPRTAELPASMDAWDAVITLALFHRVAPLLWVNLQHRSVPDAVRDRLRAIYAVNLLRNLRAETEEQRIVAALRDAGVPALELKGPSLSELLYGDPGVRQCADLDILVQPENLERANSLLGLLGYARESPSQLTEARKNHQLLYCRPRIDGPDFYLDLHQRLQPYASSDALAERIWHEGMSPENLLLYLCVNQITHRFSRLKHALDVQKVLERWGATLHWDRFAQRAREIAWTPGVAECLRWSRELFGWKMPQQVSEAFRPDRSGQRLLRLALGGSALSGLARGAILDGPYGAMVTLACTQPGAARARQAWRLLFPPAAYLREQSFARSSQAVATLSVKRLGRNLSVALRQLLLSGR
jgi:hypothetical protein